MEDYGDRKIEIILYTIIAGWGVICHDFEYVVQRMVGAETLSIFIMSKAQQ